MVKWIPNNSARNTFDRKTGNCWQKGLKKNVYFYYPKYDILSKVLQINFLQSAVEVSSRERIPFIFWIRITTVKSVSENEVAQSCPTLCDPMDCSLPGSSFHGIFQARILEWDAISFSRSSRHRDWTQISHIVGRCFTVWTTREARKKCRTNLKFLLNS